MSPKKDRMYKAEYAKVLISIANGDLESAEILRAGLKGRQENTCYLAEQCIEKSLKALLVHLNMPVPLTHDLGLISERLSTRVKLPTDVDLSQFNEFATTRRYEEGALVLDDDDLDAAISLAKEILEWAKSILQS